MGNVLNWTYFDIRARYKRMQGYNVHFPQGWDCHGMPTEVAVEKNKKIRRSDVPPDVFRKMCEEWVEQYIGKMKEAIVRLCKASIGHLNTEPWSQTTSEKFS